MASIRDLKKDINYVLGDIIEGVYVWEYENTDKGTEKSEAIIDEAIVAFDELIAQVNVRDVEDRKLHLKSVSKALEDKANELVEKLNKL